MLKNIPTECAFTDYKLQNMCCWVHFNTELLFVVNSKLFLKKGDGKFNSYSRSCPSQFKKVPVSLTEEEKKYIDEKDKETNSKSYDEYITYGSGDDKYHYICPRYWCLRDDNGKGRSLTLKQINDGECGGWDALIPEKAKKVYVNQKSVFSIRKIAHMGPCELFLLSVL